MLLICKYWFETYKALDDLGKKYIAIIDESDVNHIDPSHELLGGMKNKFVVSSVDSIESLTSVANILDIMEIHIDRVISIGELSQYGAGFLTERLGCKGLSFDTINMTRDKRLMKKKFKDISLPCADFHLISSDTDSLRFNYPMVAKPVCGFGSFNTEVINNETALADYISSFRINKDSHLISNSIMLEEYISGHEYCADCLIKKSEIKLLSISEYNMPRMYVTNEKVKYDSAEHLNYHRHQELYSKIDEFYQRIIREFKIDDCVCHLEFFVNEENAITLSEIATRPGGSYFNHMAKCVYGKTLYEAWFDSILNNNDCSLPELYPDEEFIIVNIIPQKTGILNTLPKLEEMIKYRTLEHVIPRKKPGEKTHSNIRTDYTCFFVFRGKNIEEIKTDIDSFVRNFDFDIS
ncbi:acetyl-CoA carboxylase biotin carboxylase subunit family protein [Serratia liquefaciens]|uniref:ATP-grasp domain-containing protein n=1 Tax=Serratia liquefaciens TaxID=614 RepID=UPI0021827A3D|nr:ATP-grasp domain-containing protein [Serratia liquefaciens]CAI2518723.1 carbamoyl phosphate synthase-like protein [Serratia liquefaciens]